MFARPSARRRCACLLLPLLALAAAPGCEDRPARSRTARKTIKSREILGKTTQDIRRAGPELQQGGAREAQRRITAQDPITLPGNAYVVSVGKIAMGQVHQAIEMYRALNGDYPRTYDEFMEGVIKPGQPDGIRLPQLPYYQEYGYDEKTHELIVLEYPDRKAQFQKQQDEELGRK